MQNGITELYCEGFLSVCSHYCDLRIFMLLLGSFG